MSPRPAPDLDLRRDRIIRVARRLAEANGWSAVTMRRLAGELGVTQPVIYSAVTSRQALIDAVALAGFAELAEALEAAAATPIERMRAYLDFAASNPRVYDAMFSMPSDLGFATVDPPEPLKRAFSSLREVFPHHDDTRAEVAWSALHGLATLEAGDRLRPGQSDARLELLDHMLTHQDN